MEKVNKCIPLQCSYKEIGCISLDTLTFTRTVDCKDCSVYKETVESEKKDIFQTLSNGLTAEEDKELNYLQRLQCNHNRWFSQEEFDRLKELQDKVFVSIIGDEILTKLVNLMKEYNAYIYAGENERDCQPMTLVIRREDKDQNIEIKLGDSINELTQK